jgi:prepilin-type N-terminal cleavage/methylation domain-containing protein
VDSARSRFGFSLIEVLISLAVMGIALLALVNVLTSGLKAQDKTESGMTGYLVADRVLDVAARELPQDDDFWSGDFSTTPWKEGDETVGHESYHYLLTAQDVQNQLTGRPFGAARGAEDNGLRVLLVKVSWATSGQAQSGVGKREIMARRLLNRRPE